jgi:alpha-L-arabinofuranosidase
VFLINRHVKCEARVDVSLGSSEWSATSITTLTADSCKATNSPEMPTNVVPQSKAAASVQTDGRQLSLVLSRHSLTLVEMNKVTGGSQP